MPFPFSLFLQLFFFLPILAERTWTLVWFNLPSMTGTKGDAITYIIILITVTYLLFFSFYIRKCMEGLQFKLILSRSSHVFYRYNNLSIICDSDISISENYFFSPQI